MGGRITVASTLGAGSTFTLELPAGAEAVESAAAPYQMARRVVLIVDEDPRSLAACMKAWSGLDYSAEFATTCGEAARKATALRPFLVVANHLTAPSLDAALLANAAVVLYSAGDSQDERVLPLTSPGLTERFEKIAAEALSPSGNVAALMHSLAMAETAEESGVIV